MADRALTRLALAQFRNYAALDLALDARPVVLFGANGAGKTNVLEAVSCLAPGRGLRRASVEELARRSDSGAAGPWAVSVDLALGAEKRRLGVGQDPAQPSRRIARLDAAAATQGDLGALLALAWITPAHDRLFAGARSDRLRFLDRLALALAPGHGAAAAAYERALRQRQRVLDEGRRDPAWLDGLEHEMAAAGASLAETRVRLLARLQSAIDSRPDGAFPKGDLALDGALEARIAAGESASAAAQTFQAELARVRGRDARAGRALSGPHRTDLVVTHRPKAALAADCSTGEQKALLMGLILAHARALQGGPAGAPIVLLDEACAHLDAARRAALADEIAALPSQAWLTGTDAALFDAFGARAQRVRVEDGAAVFA